MSKMLSKMNLISVFQQLPDEDIELVQKHVEMIEKEQLNSLVNSCQEEIRQLKKQLEEKENIACNWQNSCLENAGKIEILEIQQKKFIKYLEDEIKQINPKDLGIGELNLRLDDIKFTQYLIYKEILQKYKEIIGENKDEKF